MGWCGTRHMTSGEAPRCGLATAPPSSPVRHARRRSPGASPLQEPVRPWLHHGHRRADRDLPRRAHAIKSGAPASIACERAPSLPHLRRRPASPSTNTTNAAGQQRPFHSPRLAASTAPWPTLHPRGSANKARRVPRPRAHAAAHLWQHHQSCRRQPHAPSPTSVMATLNNGAMSPRATPRAPARTDSSRHPNDPNPTLATDPIRPKPGTSCHASCSDDTLLGTVMVGASHWPRPRTRLAGAE